MAGKTARYYAANPSARKRKNDYQKKFNKQPEQVKKRVALITFNRKQTKLGNNRVGDNTDASHKGSKIVGYSSQSRNRSDRNNSPGDRRARGKKRK